MTDKVLSSRKIPYQYIADSPSVRYYVSWKEYEPYLTYPPRPPLSGDIDSLLLSTYSGEIDVYIGTKSVSGNIRRITRIKGFANFNPREGKLLAYHLEHWDTGVLIELNNDHLTVAIEKPLDGYKGYHIAIDARGTSGLTLLYLAPSNAEGLATISIEVLVRSNSTLTLNNVIFDSNSSPGAIYRKVVLEENSVLRNLSVLGRGKMLLVEEDTYLLGSSSALISEALLASASPSKILYVTNSLGSNSNTKSIINSTGFVLDSLLIHKGVCKITRRGYGSSAILNSSLTPLTSNAKAYGSPMLEIDTGRVREVRHTAAISPLDEKILFYLRSRGLDDREALRLIVEGAYRASMEKIESRDRGIDDFLQVLLNTLKLVMKYQ